MVIIKVVFGSGMRSPATIGVDDGKVLKATPALRWAIGMKFIDFERRSLSAGHTLVRTRLKKGPKSLQTGPYRARKPTTRQLVERTKS